MHAARQLRAEPTLLEFACGSSFSQDTHSLTARRLLHRLVNLYLLSFIKCSGIKEDSETYDTRRVQCLAIDALAVSINLHFVILTFKIFYDGQLYVTKRK